MTIRNTFAMLAVGICAATNASAASIYLTPTTQGLMPPPSTAAFTLMMDFSPAESTVGGGIDLDVAGPGSFLSFMPSSYFTNVADPAFSGHGTLHADNDYEIHFGNFGGLSGLHDLGRVTVSLTGVPGIVSVSLAENQFFGGFYSAINGAPLPTTMTGAIVTVVPEPQATALLLAGLVALGVATRRRPSRA